MRKTLAVIFLAMLIGCSHSSFHPPTTSVQQVKLSGNYLGKVAETFFESKKNYNVSEKASNMLWLEHVIEQAQKVGTIKSEEERLWLRKFYAEKLFNDPSRIPTTVEETTRILQNYATENPPPFEPEAEGNDVLVPHILIEAIEGFNPSLPVYAASDNNGWLVLGKSRANAAALARTEMKREGLAWRAKGMRSVRFHPAQLKNLSLPNPFTGSNILWAKIENVYFNWSERWFVDTSGSGPCLLVK
jgi:hypothetical protein